MFCRPESCDMSTRSIPSRPVPSVPSRPSVATTTAIAKAHSVHPLSLSLSLAFPNFLMPLLHLIFYHLLGPWCRRRWTQQQPSPPGHRPSVATTTAIAKGTQCAHTHTLSLSPLPGALAASHLLSPTRSLVSSWVDTTTATTEEHSAPSLSLCLSRSLHGHPLHLCVYLCGCAVTHLFAFVGYRGAVWS